MAERSLELDSIELAAAIFGSGDQNIHLLEKEFRVTAVCRGSVLRFTGEQKDVDAAARAVDGMVTLMENHTPLEEQTVRYCISLAHGGEEKRLRELTDDFVAVTAKGRPIHPKTLGQKEYLAAIRKNAITFGVGPAGTGKTYLAVAMAVKAFKSKDVSRIILTRPAVEAGEKLGFLPGDLQNKVDPYLRPLYDGLFDLLGAETFQKLFEKQVIEVAPLAYMRGRTLDDAFIILDEAQNTTPEQMKMFLTRMGVGSKVVVTGDVTQIDLPDKVRRSCNAVLDFEHFDGPAEISVTFVDNNRIHELNKEYRDKDSATDVLSFPLGENGEYDIDEDNGCKLLGDIVISMERAMEQAELYGHSLQREVAYLTVHSMLHLLGYDHEAGGLEAVRMREKEEAVLIQLGLPRTVSYTSDEI
uniref:rRNA maturation RNase YbeY n=1 Tax=Gemmiger formicilis TaxID=745368 RepID=UPI003FF04A4D